MPERLSSPSVVRFGVFEVDLRSGELRKQGLKVKLQQQPFRILEMLFEQPGEVVSREQLQQRLWPEGTFVDFDKGLNIAVKKLREALGDVADSPRFIETLARRGYRFIAPVETADRALPPPTESKVFRRRWLWWSSALAAVGLSLVVGLTAWVKSPPPEPKVVNSVQITRDGQRKLAAVMFSQMASDGERLYFTEVVANQLVLAQVSTQGGESLQIPIPLQNPALLDMAPSRSQLLVSSRVADEQDRPFWIVPLPTGSPYRLGDLRGHDELRLSSSAK